MKPKLFRWSYLCALPGLTCLAVGVWRISAASVEPDVRRDATVEAVEKVMPAVVNIATETIIRVRDTYDEFFSDFWGPYHRRQPPNSQYSLGSGVIIDEAGYLLTNDHVVRRADKIYVKRNAGTNYYEAVVVASDPKSDVALLKLQAGPGEKFQAIKFAPEDDLLLGETVLALGNPFGLGGSVTRGILSSKNRSVPKEGATLVYQNWLQTDAPINPGNSGGPLVNLRGELIGINVQNVPGAQSIGFAIPIKQVLAALSDIFPTESVKSFWFGARVKVGTSPLLVTMVQPESPAGKAGLVAGDTISEVNGRTPKSFIDFAELLTTNGADAKLTFQRGGERRGVTVRLVPESSVFNAELVRNKLGLSLVELTPELAARYHVSAANAFVITSVRPDGPAAARGLQEGMLVTAVDEQVPSTLVAVAKQLYSKKRGDPIPLELTLQQQVGPFVVQQPVTVEFPIQ